MSEEWIYYSPATTGTAPGNWNKDCQVEFYQKEPAGWVPVAGPGPAWYPDCVYRYKIAKPSASDFIEETKNRILGFIEWRADGLRQSAATENLPLDERHKCQKWAEAFDCIHDEIKRGLYK